MHSEDIDRRARTRATRKVLTRRHLLLWGSTLSVGTALSGCAGGTSREAARGREEDSSSESVVKDLQATETWNLVNATLPPGTQVPDGE
jgi:hypothetical protein